MGKQRPERPTLAQKKLISRCGLVAENWLVLSENDSSVVILSKHSGQRRILKK